MELTEKGTMLEEQLTAEQRARIARAYREAGAEAVDGFRKVMLGIIGGEDDRKRFERCVDRLVAIVRGELPDQDVESDLAAAVDAVAIMEAAYASDRARTWTPVEHPLG